MSTATNENKLRHHAEQQFAEELEELKKSDARQRPANWELSPWAVCTYLLGGELDNGFTVSAKYIGNRRIIETAVATLATDRALLLYGVPGTAKSWVSEHLAAAISGDSTRIIQGTAGTSEEQCGMAGTMRNCSPKGRPAPRWSKARSCAPCPRAASPAWRN